MRGMQLAKTSRNRTQRFAATSVAFGSARFGNGAGTTALNRLALEVRHSTRDGLERELRRSDLKSIRVLILVFGEANIEAMPGLYPGSILTMTIPSSLIRNTIVGSSEG